jgi:DNA-directed RNA polymerase beta' subunit
MEQIIEKHTKPQQVRNVSVTSIQLGLLSSDEIISQSVVEVTSLSMEPEKPGLHSQMLGTINKFTPCGTCNQFVES